MAQIQFLSARAVLFVVLIILALIVYLKFLPAPDEPSAVEKANVAPVNPDQEKSIKKESINMATWETVKQAAMSSKVIKPTEGLVDIGGKGKDTAFRREFVDTTLDKPKGNILLLHGMKFTSKTWLELGTLHVMASYGYRVIAVDLPGYGSTPAAKDKDPVNFMTELFKVLGLKEAVVVSPSMSGTYSVPFLFKHSELFKGYVPVAPVGSDKYLPDDYKKLKVRVMSITGDQDKTGLAELSQKNFANVVNTESVVLSGAGHASYLDEPLLFHKHLREFSDKVYAA